MPLADHLVTIHRDPDSGALLARGGDPAAHSVLQRCGFVPVHRVHETYHRAPTGLDKAEGTGLAAEAVGRLRAMGHQVDCDECFDTEQRPTRHVPLGAQVAQLADRIREATTTQEAAGVLTELTAAHDGILAGIEDVLTATADFHDELGDPAGPYIARRLRYLAEEHLGTIRADLANTRDTLADRHVLPHPGRSTCTTEAPATEREASQACACPPAAARTTGGPRR